MDEYNCQHLLVHLSDFVDGEASIAICAEIESHTSQCQKCRIVVDTLRRVQLQKMTSDKTGK